MKKNNINKKINKNKNNKKYNIIDFILNISLEATEKGFVFQNLIGQFTLN